MSAHYVLSCNPLFTPRRTRDSLGTCRGALRHPPPGRWRRRQCTHSFFSTSVSFGNTLVATHHSVGGDKPTACQPRREHEPNDTGVVPTRARNKQRWNSVPLLLTEQRGSGATCPLVRAGPINTRKVGEGQFPLGKGLALEIEDKVRD